MELTSYAFRIWIEIALVAGLVFASWRWGAGPERILASVLVWFLIADPAYHAIFTAPVDLGALDVGHVVIELVATVVSTIVALYANRMYTLWFAAFQFLAMFAHLARELAQSVAPLAYGIMYIGPFFFQIIILTGGLLHHARRERRHGPYRTWRTSSPRSPAMERRTWPKG